MFGFILDFIEYIFDERYYDEAEEIFYLDFDFDFHHMEEEV